jgi:hypothetical protein
MAGRFEFALAGAAEDAELRALLREIAMPGQISLAFLREPSFFLAERAGNTSSQVMVCRDREQGRIVGVGSRSVRCVYVDGAPTRVGYLSMLRGIPRARGNIGLARGYRYLKQLHGDGAVPYYFTTILDDNAEAVKLLTSGRAGLPVYQPVARLVTYLIPLARRRPGQPTTDGAVSHVGRGERDVLAQAVTRLNEWNSRFQFATVYTPQDLAGETDLLPGFSWENLYVYRDGESVVGTLGVWDQVSFKQTVVTAYSRQMQAMRPVYNLYAAARGLPRLPDAGASIKILYAAFASGDGPVFAELLDRVRADWSGAGYDYLAVGFAAQSECAPIASRHATQRIDSTLYVVSWPDQSAVALPEADRPVHVEIATL